MTALFQLLDTYRQAAQSEREKGTYFEELIIQYLKNEATYKDLYSQVWTYKDWLQNEPEAQKYGLNAKDTGIDLVAKTTGTNEYHAIQCKLYAADYKLRKEDIDSFFTASGKSIFKQRIIVSTCLQWTEHAEDALIDQNPPVYKIDLTDLQNSQIAWEQYQPQQPVVFKPKKQLREHQRQALMAVKEGLADAARGKLIMACGTGKTFTSLKIAEELAGKGKRVLFLVPSLSLLSQTLTEWTQESATPLHSFAVCSDSDVGKKRDKNDDTVNTFVHELRYPATTNPKRLVEEMNKRHDAEHMSVVFSTYHSIGVVSDAQNAYGLAEFDLIVCDEAHRTTGVAFDGEDESAFVQVHDADFIHAKKRLYMTATPRIYGEEAELNAEKDKAKLFGMNNLSIYGKELFVINFSEAVQRGLLVDYKVIVLAVDESHVNKRLQDLLADENNSLKVDDAAKIIGCWKALSKQNSQTDLQDDPNPMQRAVAFCQVIEPSSKARQHKVSSKNIAGMFQAVVEAYQEQEKLADPDNEALVENYLQCTAEHVDGGMNASEKEAKLQWLKAQPAPNTCKILSNVRCLSEGVDVPSLDAVLFLTPRNSQVDVVQSVGRVMRLAEGKKRGYVILPVVIPAGVEPHQALNDNKTYKVVWQVLQALRAHDDRFDAMINQLELNNKKPVKMEVIAITDKIQKRTKTTASGTGNKGKSARVGTAIGTSPSKKELEENQTVLNFEIDELERAIYAKVVQKCGNRQHWEDWANDIAKIAKTHIDRITHILNNPAHTEEIAAFKAFAAELRDDLNDAITDAEIIEMLAQHLITKPVFDALFSEYSFAKHNPMSLAMQAVLDKLQEHHLEKEADTLNSFYASVKMRAEGIDNAQGKQTIIKELYEKFFKNAFPKVTDKFGIVYTPVEVVDFILHSVNDILKQEFNQTLADDNVHIIDPFTGTGTFITRLLQSGLIPDSRLSYKYKHEIHANEIVLLAYYIACINIEAVYHDIIFDDYTPFNGICLTDTFQMYEKEDLVDELLVQNSARRKRQKELDIQVIIGNPPYSKGQSSADDNNQNIKYSFLESRIKESYAKESTGSLKNSLYDSYIKALRWATDRVNDQGVIAFVSGNGFVDKPVMNGVRRVLTKEFSKLYILNLRGDIRKNMLSKGLAKEGENIFESGSMNGIAISILVKTKNHADIGRIFYGNIGDDLKLNAKKKILTNAKSIFNNQEIIFKEVFLDKFGDWINHRDNSIQDSLSLFSKNEKSLFINTSLGVSTSRDPWAFNFSKNKLSKNMVTLIDTYDLEVARLKEAISNDRDININDFILIDPTKINWSSDLKKILAV